MTAVDWARVDLGAAHNGRVKWRNVFERTDGTRFIVNKGKHVTVIQLTTQRKRGHIHYVLAS